MPEEPFRIYDWLESIKKAEYADAFEKNNIDLDALRSLSEENLKELGVLSIGHRKEILAEIGKTKRKHTTSQIFATHDAAVTWILSPFAIGLVGMITLSAQFAFVRASLGLGQRNIDYIYIMGAIFGFALAITIWTGAYLTAKWKERDAPQMLAVLIGVCLPGVIYVASGQSEVYWIWIVVPYGSVVACFSAFMADKQWWAWCFLSIPILADPMLSLFFAPAIDPHLLIQGLLIGVIGYSVMGIAFRYNILRNVELPIRDVELPEAEKK